MTSAGDRQTKGQAPAIGAGGGKRPVARGTLTMADTPHVLLPGRLAEELVLTFAGNIVKHLGVQMYAGRPVPAIAELISNAWDADATVVDVQLPLGEPW